MWLAFRDVLPKAVVDEMDHYSAVLRGFLYTQHNEDGSHSDVTADSVTTPLVSTPKIIGTGPDAGDRLIVTDTAGTPLFRVGQERSPAVSGLQRKRNVSPLDMQLFQRLALGTRVDTTISSGSLHPSNGYENGLGPDQIYYNITSATGSWFRVLNSLGTIQAAPDLQVIVAVNNTGSTLQVGDPILAPAFTNGIYGGPITLANGGGVVLVYDHNTPTSQGGGWQIIGHSGLGWASYTPSFINIAGDATVGAGSVNGFYCVDGHVCHVHARAVMGSGFSWGSGGVVGISLPFDVASFVSVNRYIFDAMLFDSSTPYAGKGQFVVLSGQDCVGLRHIDLSNGQLSPVTGSTPFSWASGDRVDVVGTYPI